jgi:hypothetical protein
MGKKNCLQIAVRGNMRKSSCVNKGKKFCWKVVALKKIIMITRTTMNGARNFYFMRTSQELFALWLFSSFSPIETFCDEESSSYLIHSSLGMIFLP